MLKEIITEAADLHQRAVEIAVRPNQTEIDQIVEDLKDTIREKQLLALTAPQLGYARRIFCVNFDGDIRTFINPMIIKMQGLFLSREHCASVEGEYIIPRHEEIAIAFQTPTGKPEANQFDHEVAAVIEQCQDLLDGVLLSDYGLLVDEAFDQATDEEREEVLGVYMQSLEETLQQLNQEIERDDTLKQTRDAIDFMESVAKGETALEEPKQPKLNRATRRLIDKWTRKKKKSKVH